MSEVRVKVTSAQEAVLFEELAARRDEGALRFALRGGRVLAGSPADLAAVAYRVENSLAVAEAAGRPRARALAGVMRRLARAGVNPEPPARVAREGVQGNGGLTVVPESQFTKPPPKPLHHSKRNRTWYTVEQMRRGRAAGRRASKQAWSSKAAKRSGDAGMVRGDPIFTRGIPEPKAGRPNDERAVWLRAGTEQGARSSSRARSREAAKSLAQAAVKDKLPVRVERGIAAAQRKFGRVRACQVSGLLVAEDVRAGRYGWSTSKQRAARARYTKAAQKRIAQLAQGPQVRTIESPTNATLRAAARRGRKVERVKWVADELAHEHEWRVSPQRTRRTCMSCGRVQRKVRGRWTS